MTAFPHPFPYRRFILVFFLHGRSLEPWKFLGLLPHEAARCAPPPLSRVPGGASPVERPVRWQYPNRPRQRSRCSTLTPICPRCRRCPGPAIRPAPPRFWTTALSFDCLPGVQVHSSAWPSESYRDTQYHSRKSVHPWRRALHKRAQSPPNVPYAPIEIADSGQGFFRNAGNRWSAERVMLSGDRIGRLRSPKPRGDVHAPIRGPSNDQGAAQYVGVTRDRIQISSSVGTC